MAIKFFDKQFAQEYDQAQTKLQEWLDVGNEQESSNYIKVLDMSNDSFTLRLFTYMTDISVQSALDSLQKMAPYGKLYHNPAMDFSQIDAFSKLIIIILKSAVNTNKKDLLQKILQGIVLVLTKNHMFHKSSFNQRPFFRLFYNILYVSYICFGEKYWIKWGGGEICINYILNKIKL